MKVIETFEEVVANRHQYAREWKQRNGGRVVGWLWSGFVISCEASQTLVSRASIDDRCHTALGRQT